MSPVRLSVSRVAAVVGLLGLGSAGAAFADANLYVYVTNAGAGGVKPGGSVAYKIDVQNNGNADAAGVVVTNPTPDGLPAPSVAGGGCTAFPCTLGTLPAFSASATITVTFNVPSSFLGANPIVDTATVSTTSPESDLTNNSASAATAVTRVAGFYTLPPCRIVDTRLTTGVPIGGPAMASGETRTLAVREACGLPAKAFAVAYNATVTGATGAGNLQLYPGNQGPPPTSAINYSSGQTRANNGIVPLSADGRLSLRCNQASGMTDFILDVNGYFAATDEVSTPVGPDVHVRPAPEVAITFDNVTEAGVTTALVVEFGDNRPTGGQIRAQAGGQYLKDFFPPGSPLNALLPNVLVPGYVEGLPKGGPGGTPTFVLAIIDTTAKFTRTAEFHGLEDFLLGWHPPCVDTQTPTNEPRTFYAREEAKNEPILEEEFSTETPIFVDISSGCGSNKGSGWNFSLYLTARDTRTPHDIAVYMLQHLLSVLGSQLSSYITDVPVESGVRSMLLNDVQNAQASLDTNPAASFANMNDFIAIVDANPDAFDNVRAVRNVSGELVGRAMSVNYMLLKLMPAGTIVEFPVPTHNSNPYGIEAGPDGNLWFTEQLGNKIARITPAGKITEFTVPTASSEPIAITAGPDGNMWFVEVGGNKVGRITPAGDITEFPVPGASLLYEIAAGADGNLWLVDRQGGPTFKIRRITPTGTITDFPSPVSSTGMTAGPDGNIWFTAYTENQIGRITPAGVVTVFPVPTGNSSPNGITKGPDGNLWFTEQAANRIGRMTTAGVVTEFPIPAPASSAYGIKAGADGNLWFAALSGHIGRITPAGAVTVFPVPSQGSEPHMVAAGPDGNVWFTNRAGNKIGRITP